METDVSLPRELRYSGLLCSNYRRFGTTYLLRNNTEERSYHLLRGGRL